MKKRFLALTLFALLVLSLAGCGNVPAAEPEAPAAEEQTAPAETAEAETAPAEGAEAETASGRQDGERYEMTIMLEGEEETVGYEHAVSQVAGMEMGFEYESFARYTEADRELFISLYDDPAEPMNYLEVKADTGNTELVASAISATLSGAYEVNTEDFELAGVGRCLRITAFHVKGTDIMAGQLQEVYVIPAADGCRIATAHYTLESAEGFGRRMDAMLNTLTLLERNGGAQLHGDAVLTDEQALAAIENYCRIANPDLQEVEAKGYEVFWEIVSSDDQQIVVLYRSYTGAEVRYYIDRATGMTYSTEFVSGITAEEQRTDETINVWDYVL